MTALGVEGGKCEIEFLSPPFSFFFRARPLMTSSTRSTPPNWRLHSFLREDGKMLAVGVDGSVTYK